MVQVQGAKTAWEVSFTNAAEVLQLLELVEFHLGALHKRSVSVDSSRDLQDFVQQVFETIVPEDLKVEGLPVTASTGNLTVASLLSGARDELSSRLRDLKDRQMEEPHTTNNDFLQYLKHEKQQAEERCTNMGQRYALLEQTNQDLRCELAKAMERCEQQKLRLAQAEERLDQMETEKKSLRGELSEWTQKFAALAEQHQPRPDLQVGAAPGGDTCLRAEQFQIGSSAVSEGSVFGLSWTKIDQTEFPSEPTIQSPSESGSAGGLSATTSLTNCFDPAGVFQMAAGHQLPAHLLRKGSEVLAADGTLLQVCNEPETKQVDKVVEIFAGKASLVVTEDHRVAVHDDATGAQIDVLAGKLQRGTSVYVNNIPTKIDNIVPSQGKFDVLKIAFKPDKTVGAATQPPAIASKGSSKKSVRRGTNRNQTHNVSAEAAPSIAETDWDFPQYEAAA